MIFYKLIFVDLAVCFLDTFLENFQEFTQGDFNFSFSFNRFAGFLKDSKCHGYSTLVGWRYCTEKTSRYRVQLTPLRLLYVCKFLISFLSVWKWSNSVCLETSLSSCSAWQKNSCCKDIEITGKARPQMLWIQLLAL